MTSPLARGLFHGAIMQSGSCATQTRAAAQTASLAFAKQAGCPDAATAVACLRARPEKTVLDASASYQPLFTPAQLELSRQMVRYWGAFTAFGAPEVPGQPLWPRYTSGQLMSLRPGDQAKTISAATFGTEHQCSFWDAG